MSYAGPGLLSFNLPRYPHHPRLSRLFSPVCPSVRYTCSWSFTSNYVPQAIIFVPRCAKTLFLFESFVFFVSRDLKKFVLLRDSFYLFSFVALYGLFLLVSVCCATWLFLLLRLLRHMVVLSYFRLLHCGVILIDIYSFVVQMIDLISCSEVLWITRNGLL